MSGRGAWWQLFGLLAVALVAWSLSTPLFSGPDEADHAVRAAAVVRGQLGGSIPPNEKSNEVITVNVKVPQVYRLTREMSCFFAGPRVTPNCAPRFSGATDSALVITGQQRSGPAYYAVVGLASLGLPPEAAAYGMRILSALLCAALLSAALLSVMSLPNRAIATVGVMTAITPQVLYLGGLINSNSIEIAAGVCLWASALAMVRMPEPPPLRLVAQAGIAFIVLVTARGLSIGYGLIIVAITIVVCDRQRRWELARRADVRTWAAVSGAAVVAAGAWLLYVSHKYPLHAVGSGIGHAIGRTPEFLRQSVGVLSFRAASPLDYRDLALPAIVYVIWGLLVVGLVVAAIVSSRWQHGAALGAVIVICLVLPVLADGANIPPINVFWQGRHGLPLACGIPILAGALIDPAHRRLARFLHNPRPFVASALVCLAAGQVVAFIWMLHRVGVGYGGTTNPFRFLLHPDWHPRPGPALLYLAVFTVAIAGVTTVALRAALAPEPVSRGSS